MMKVNTRIGENVKKIKHIYQIHKKALMIIVALCFVFQGTCKIEPAKADVGVTVNYVDQMAYVTTATGTSTRYYVSTDQKNWEAIDSSNAFDISGYLAAKDVVLYFKGNKDATPISYTLTGEVSDINVTYEIVEGVGRVTFTSTGGVVEYKRGENGTWRTATSPMPTSIYEVKGTTLYFRTTAGVSKRSGKVVTVKIPKRPTAPSVKLDGSKLCITGLKSGETQYRVGDNAAWTTFTTPLSSIKYINLSALLNTAANVPNTVNTVEFRTIGSNKKVYSNTKVIDIPAQPICPEVITLTGTTLKASDIDLKKQYEYTIVSQGYTLDLGTARWTSFTSKNAVVLTKAKINDKIYVRAKSYTDSNKNLVLASTYKELPVTSITTK